MRDIDMSKHVGKHIRVTARLLSALAAAAFLLAAGVTDVSAQAGDCAVTPPTAGQGETCTNAGSGCTSTGGSGSCQTLGGPLSSCVCVISPPSVPAMGQWGMLALAGLLLASGIFVVTRRRA